MYRSAATAPWSLVRVKMSSITEKEESLEVRSEEQQERKRATTHCWHHCTPRFIQSIRRGQEQHGENRGRQPLCSERAPFVPIAVDVRYPRRTAGSLSGVGLGEVDEGAASCIWDRVRQILLCEPGDQREGREIIPSVLTLIPNLGRVVSEELSAHVGALERQ